MKKLCFLLLGLCALCAPSLIRSQEKTYVEAKVTKTETVEVKTQSRVVRVEIFADNPKAVQFVSHHQAEQSVADKAAPIGGWSRSARTVSEDKADTAEVDGIAMTREQLIAYAVAFAEKDRAEDEANAEANR